MSYVAWFDEFDPVQAARLGGKCAALGELTAAGLPVPPGFAVTVHAYRAACASLREQLDALLSGCADDDPARVAHAGAAMRALVEAVRLPDDVRDGLAGAYAELCRRCLMGEVPVAVRSSAL